jgi:hypothetical protein
MIGSSTGEGPANRGSEEGFQRIGHPQTQVAIGRLFQGCRNVVLKYIFQEDFEIDCSRLGQLAN